MKKIDGEEDELGENPEVVLRDYILENCNPKMTLAEFRRYLMTEFADYSSDTIAGAVKLWTLWFLRASVLSSDWMIPGKKVGQGPKPYHEQQAEKLARMLDESNFTFDSRMLDVTEFLKKYSSDAYIRIAAYKLWRDRELAKETPKAIDNVGNELLIQSMVRELIRRKYTTTTPYAAIRDVLLTMCPVDEYLRGVAFARWFNGQLREQRAVEEPPYPVTHRRLGIKCLYEDGYVQFYTDAATAESLRKYDPGLYRSKDNPKSDLWVMHVDHRWDFAEVFAYLRWLEKQPAIEPLAAQINQT